MQRIHRLLGVFFTIIVGLFLISCDSLDKPLTPEEQAEVNAARQIANTVFSMRHDAEDLRDWHHDQMGQYYRVYVNKSEQVQLWWTAYDKKDMNRMHQHTGPLTAYKLLKSKVYQGLLGSEYRNNGTWVALTYHVKGEKAEADETLKLWKIDPKEKFASRMSALNGNTYRIIYHSQH